MRVAVIGAGLSGLAAARALKAAGQEVVIFERDRVPGGRVSTIQLGDYIFDPGATSFAPRGKALERVMLDELPTEDLVRVEKPIYVHESLRPRAGDLDKNAINRYTYKSGNAALPRMLAEGLSIRFERAIAEIKKLSEGGFLVDNDFFEWVIVALPAPEALALLQASGEQRPLSNVFYRPCVSVLLGYAHALLEVRYHALLDPEQRHPLTWLSLESTKSPGRVPEGYTALVAQMSPQFSTTHFESPERLIVELTADYIERLYGKEWAAPAISGVVRYRHSQPESIASFDVVNRSGVRLIVAGDSLLGSRTEHAYESGLRAAALVTPQ